MSLILSLSNDHKIVSNYIKQLDDDVNVISIGYWNVECDTYIDCEWKFNWMTYCKANKNVVIVANPFDIPEFVITFDNKIKNNMYGNIEWIILLSKQDGVNDVEKYCKLLALTADCKIVIIENEEYTNYVDTIQDNIKHPYEPIVIINDEIRYIANNTNKNTVCLYLASDDDELINLVDYMCEKSKNDLLQVRIVQNVDELDIYNIKYVPALTHDNDIVYFRDEIKEYIDLKLK